jgi:hypothetical protein
MMKHLTSPLLALACALLLAGCGQRSDDVRSSSTSAATGPAAGGATAIPAVSKYDAGPRAGESPADETLAAEGEKLFSTKGCTACHAQGRRLTGPDLAGASMRRTQEWLEQQILDPGRMVKEDPIARELLATYALQMPKQGLTPDEAQAVIEFLKRYDQKAGLQPAAANQ